MHLADHEITLSPHNTKEYTLDVPNGVIEEMPPRHKVCIIGAGHGMREAPLDDPAWSVWALNLVAPFDSAGRLRADRWFELHQRCAQTADDIRWIERCPIPIYLPPDLVDCNPMGVRFPLERLERAFPGYWACTFAYQIALALSEDFKHIGLYGVELAYGTKRERSIEWANVSWWMGYAEAKGVTFHLPTHSRLGYHHYRYGLDYTNEKDFTGDYVDMMDRVDRERQNEEGMGG